MRFNRTLGLTLVAAALMTAYGCGKEEPKKGRGSPGRHVRRACRA